MDDAKASATATLDEVLAAHVRSHRRRRRLLWAFSIVFLASVVFFVASWFHKSKQPEVTQYKTESCRRGDLVVTVSATGRLEPTNEVVVGCEQSGTVESVLVECNDTVKVGQVLVQLDVTKVSAQIAQTQAELASSKAQLLVARATVREVQNNLRRLKELRKIGGSKAISQKDLDSAQADLDRALATVKQNEAVVHQNEASLESNKTDLSKMTIYSPINGVVLSRAIETGQTVAASFTTPNLFTIAEDLSRMQLKVGVDEADIGLVQAGQKATFTVDAYGSNKFSATIRRVDYGATISNNVVTYRTILDVDNKDLKLRPGMTATAVITVKELQNAVLIPNTALRFEPLQEPAEGETVGSFFDEIMMSPASTTEKTKSQGEATEDTTRAVVWALKNGRLTPLGVKTGSTDGRMTEVLEGDVQPGMELVVDSTTKESL
jgi:HlyD family secretion protein